MLVSTMGLTQDKTIPPFLNDPAATARGMTINSVGEDNISVTTNGTDSRKAYTLPLPPAGSVVSFDVTHSQSFYMRMDDETGLENPTTALISQTVPGTYHYDITIPAHGTNTLFGFLTAASAATIQITNWRVTRP